VAGRRVQRDVRVYWAGTMGQYLGSWYALPNEHLPLAGVKREVRRVVVGGVIPDGGVYVDRSAHLVHLAAFHDR
jgi:hypothetical protein